MNRYKKGALIVGLLSFFIPAIVYAADSSSIAAIPWETALENMVIAVQKVARPVVSVLVAFTGIMVLFGSGEGQLHSLFRLVLGIGLALQVGDIITGSHSLFPEIRDVALGNVAKPTPPIISFSGQDKGINFIGNFMTYYENLCIYGAAMLAPHALKILGFLTIIEMTITLIFKLEGDHIKYLLHTALKTGFYIFLVKNWIGGTGALMNIANTMFTSFEKYGLLAAGAENLSPENTLVNGFEIVSTVVSSIKNSAADGSILMISSGLLIVIVVFVCVMITALQIIITRFEFWTVAMLVVILIPFGAYKNTRFLFEKAIGAVFNSGIKIMAVSFVCAVSAPLINGMVSQLDSSWSVSAMGSNFVLLLSILVGTLLLAVLSIKIPAVAAGLLNGNPSLASGDMLAPVKMAAAGAGNTARIAGAINQASNMEGGATALNTIKKAGGEQTGWAGRQFGTMKNLAMMANQAYNPMSQGYNEAQDNTRNRMSRNKTNSEIQYMGKVASNLDNNNISAGWRPTDSTNQQGESIKQSLDNIQKDIVSLKNKK